MDSLVKKIVGAAILALMAGMLVVNKCRPVELEVFSEDGSMGKSSSYSCGFVSKGIERLGIID